MENFNFNESYLTEGLFDDLEDDIKTDDVSDTISNMAERNYIEELLDTFNIDGEIAEETDEYYKLFMTNKSVWTMNPDYIDRYDVWEYLTDNVCNFYKYLEREMKQIGLEADWDPEDNCDFNTILIYKKK